MITRLHHVGIAVKNLNTAIKTFNKSLGLKHTEIKNVEEEKVNVAFLSIGDSSIELLEPQDEESVISKFLKNNGEGLHHITFEVDDIQLAMNTAKKAGLQLRENKPKKLKDGRLISFINPKSIHGILIEFIEKT